MAVFVACFRALDANDYFLVSPLVVLLMADNISSPSRGRLVTGERGPAGVNLPDLRGEAGETFIGDNIIFSTSLSPLLLFMFSLEH